MSNWVLALGYGCFCNAEKARGCCPVVPTVAAEHIPLILGLFQVLCMPPFGDFLPWNSAG